MNGSFLDGGAYMNATFWLQDVNGETGTLSADPETAALQTGGAPAVRPAEM